MDSGRLELEARRIICPFNGIDGAGIITVTAGCIEQVVLTDIVEGTVHPISGDLLLPGLVDLHCHIAPDQSVYGVAPDWILRSGTTTAASQGDAGAQTIEQFESMSEKNRLSIKLAINLSAVGESTQAPCFSQVAWIDVRACIAAIKRYRDLIWAVSVNTSHHACPKINPRSVLAAGIEVATETGLPVLYGMRRPEDWALADQLALLREGDVVTYCFRQSPHCIMDNDQVLPCVLEARHRGVLFDVGHGCGSFDFDVAESAINAGFLPDTISTDLQIGHMAQETTHDLPSVMSKLRAVGMPDAEIFKAATTAPASLVGAVDRAKLSVGAVADFTVLSESEAELELLDTSGKKRYSKVWTTAAVYVQGQLVK